MTYSSVAGLLGELYIISEKVWLRVVTYSWSDLTPRCDIIPQWSDSAGWQIQGMAWHREVTSSRSGQTPRSLIFQEWSDSTRSLIFKECSKSILVCWWPLFFCRDLCSAEYAPGWHANDHGTPAHLCQANTAWMYILTVLTVLQYKADVTLDSKHT